MLIVSWLCFQLALLPCSFCWQHIVSSHSRIDHCLISHKSFLKSHNVFVFFSHLHQNYTWFLSSSPSSICIRDYSIFNLESFHSSLRSFDWTSINRTYILDEKIDILSSFLHSSRHPYPLPHLYCQKII